jgi:hypothetical protein
MSVKSFASICDVSPNLFIYLFNKEPLKKNIRHRRVGLGFFFHMLRHAGSLGSRTWDFLWVFFAIIFSLYLDAK